MGWPPPDTSKKLVPKLRSNITSTSAMAMAGRARMSRKLVTSVIQVNTGRRIIVRPGARMLMIVTMKFSEATMEERPRICRPSTQRSVDRSGVKIFEVSGA
jgi:hypothetical protein